MIELLIFIIGLCIGSFLGVLVDRLPKNKTIGGRSRCEFCKKNLKWSDLIPLLSFFALKGKCRYCHKKLSIFYPVIELITGIAFVLTYIVLLSFKLSIINFQLIYYLLIVSCLIVVFFSDLRYGIIPDKILIASGVFIFGYLILANRLLLVDNLASGVIAFLFFLFLFLFTKGKGMGFGDVKFAFIMGLMLGVPDIIVALYIAFLTGAAVSIILILWKGKHVLKRTIPFGPFLALATFTSLFWGNIIWQKILSLL
jgi:leader peptidase (prepilin peptidase) / N-methyltransferase